MTEPLYYVIDVRPEWLCRPYISLWGAKNSGYYYTLAPGYAGLYTRESLDPGYHYKIRYGCRRALDRFPVPREVCERLASEPDRTGRHGIEGPGLAIRNTAANRSMLRKHRLDIGDPAAEFRNASKFVDKAKQIIEI